MMALQRASCTLRAQGLLQAVQRLALPLVPARHAKLPMGAVRLVRRLEQLLGLQALLAAPRRLLSVRRRLLGHRGSLLFRTLMRNVANMRSQSWLRRRRGCPHPAAAVAEGDDTVSVSLLPC